MPPNPIPSSNTSTVAQDGIAIVVAFLVADAARLATFDTEKAQTREFLQRPDGLSGVVEAAATLASSAFQLLCNGTPLNLEAGDGSAPSLDPLQAELFVGGVIAWAVGTPLIAAARARGCGTANGDARVLAVPNITSIFQVRAWRAIPAC